MAFIIVMELDLKRSIDFVITSTEYIIIYVYKTPRNFKPYIK